MNYEIDSSSDTMTTQHYDLFSPYGGSVAICFPLARVTVRKNRKPIDGIALALPRRMKQWIVEVYEKAEHWTFETRIEASSSEEAKAQAAKDYSKRDYTIKGVFRGAF